MWPASDATSPVLARLQSLQSDRVTSQGNQLPNETHWIQLTAVTELDMDVEELESSPTELGRMTSLEY